MYSVTRVSSITFLNLFFPLTCLWRLSLCLSPLWIFFCSLVCQTSYSPRSLYLSFLFFFLLWVVFILFFHCFFHWLRTGDSDTTFSFSDSHFLWSKFLYCLITSLSLSLSHFIGFLPLYLPPPSLSLFSLWSLAAVMDVMESQEQIIIPLVRVSEDITPTYRTDSVSTFEVITTLARDEKTNFKNRVIYIKYIYRKEPLNFG